MRWLALLLLLTSCTTTALPPSMYQDVSVKINWMEPWDVTRIGKQYGHKGQLLGLAFFDGPRCTIYAPKPTGADDTKYLAVLGHELLHCTDGYFHP